MAPNFWWTRGASLPPGGLGFGDYAYLDATGQLAIGRPNGQTPTLFNSGGGGGNTSPINGGEYLRDREFYRGNRFSGGEY